MTESAGRFNEAPVTRPAGTRDSAVIDSGRNAAAAAAARQAAAGEAKVIDEDQGRSQTGQPDGASGLSTQRAGIANTPASGPCSRQAECEEIRP